MMLFSNIITNRLKAVCRFCGDTDKSHKRPRISFLEGLPVELLQFIASYLPLSAAGSFALSSRYICYVVGLNTGVSYVPNRSNMRYFSVFWKNI